MRAAARVARLERQRRAGQIDEIPISVVAWLDVGERPEPSTGGERRRRVDYRAGLHWIAPEGASDASSE